MAKFSNLQMAAHLAADPRISTQKSLFGLVNTTTYVPTGSKITAVKHEFKLEQGSDIEHALNTTKGNPAALLAELGYMEPAAIGNYLLEACYSADRNFVAMQMFQYAQLRYQPVTDVHVFEGEEAKLAAKIF